MNVFRRTVPAWPDAEIEALIAEVSPELLAYLTRRTQPVDDAADVLAETLFTVWKRRADIPPTRDRARAWMFVTARNHLSNHQRGQARRHALADQLRDNLAGYDEAAPTGDDQAELVREALGSLPPDDQELIGLIVWDGFGVAEAGAIMRLSASTARSRYQRAKARLVRTLEEQQQP